MTSKRPRAQGSLRETHSANTRSRILDGLAVIMAGGIAEVSVPAVARAANVSVPTVYRHFRTKKELVNALSEHVATSAHLTERDLEMQEDLEGLCASVPRLFTRLESMDGTLRAAMASQIGGRIRRSSLMPVRIAMIERALSAETKGFSKGDRERLRDLVLILWSSSTLSAFKEYLGLSAQDASDRVQWGIRALVRGTRGGK